MYAFTGDRIYEREEAGGPPRHAEVIAVDHPDGHPPYWVRWSDTGEESLWFPEADAVVEHSGPTYPAEYDANGTAVVPVRV